MCVGSRVGNANSRVKELSRLEFYCGAPAGGLSFGSFLPLASFDTSSYQRVCKKFSSLYFVSFFFFSLFTVFSVNCYFSSVSFFSFFFLVIHGSFAIQGLLSTGIGGGPHAPCRPGLVPHTTP